MAKASRENLKELVLNHYLKVIHEDINNISVKGRDNCARISRISDLTKVLIDGIDEIMGLGRWSDDGTTDQDTASDVRDRDGNTDD